MFTKEATRYREASRCGNDQEEAEAQAALVSAVTKRCQFGAVQCVSSYENVDDGSICNDGVFVEFDSGVIVYIPV